MQNQETEDKNAEPMADLEPVSGQANEVQAGAETKGSTSTSGTFSAYPGFQGGVFVG